MAQAANGIAARGTVQIEVAGERVELLPERGVFWPAASTLIVADLHWGKAQTFHAAGVPIPDGILEHDLSGLSRMLEATGAARLLVLGDLIHSGVGLTERLVAAVAAWRSRHGVRVELVPGNHDRHARRLPGSWAVHLLEPEVREGPFLFRHDPAGGGGPYTLSGHIHPVVRLADGAGSMRLPCFVMGAAGGVLPAFSRFCGGRAVWPAADRVFGIAGDTVFEVGVDPQGESASVR